MGLRKLPLINTGEKTMSNEKGNVFCVLQNNRSCQKPKLEGRDTFTVNWFTTICHSEILQESNARIIMFHHGNASSHSARITVGFF